MSEKVVAPYGKLSESISTSIQLLVKPSSAGFFSQICHFMVVFGLMKFRYWSVTFTNDNVVNMQRNH